MCVCVCVCVQAFIENYPQFRKLSGTATKHVAVVGELSRMVENNKLMALSEVEQDIVSGTDKNNAFRVRNITLLLLLLLLLLFTSY